MASTLSREALARLFPRARLPVLENLLIAMNGDFADAGITQTSKRLAFMLATLAEESGGLVSFDENTNYTASRIRAVWPRRPDLVRFAGDPQGLANHAYANRMGNGSPESGDGWRYRGHGPEQLTGKTNHIRIGRLVGLDLENHPELVTDPKYMFKVAAGYWRASNLNRFADRDDFTGLTQAVNGGLTNLALRRQWLRKIEAEIANTHGVAPAPANSRPLEQSRTVRGGGAAAAGGATITVDAARQAAEQVKDGLSHIQTGTTIELVIGVIILIGAATALYARWDDAGRPMPKFLAGILGRALSGGPR